MRRTFLLLPLLWVACADAGGSNAAGPSFPPNTSSPSASDAGADGADGSATPFVEPPRLGANVTKDGVVFKVWAPNATKVSVSGDFGENELARESGGVFGATVASARAGMKYRFVLETPNGKLERVDPYCRELVPPAGTTCTIVDPNTYAWKTTTFTRPKREAAVVYEMHVGSFAADPAKGHGTFASAMARLPRLADLGINVVELMPVHAFGGTNASWGYNPHLFFAPKTSYGTSSELRAFVDEAHRLGIAVWIDTVVNHLDGWKQAPLRCFDGCANESANGNGIYFFGPGPYATTPWGPRPNYVEPEVKEMLVASHRSWLTEYRGDGFRIDSVSNIRAIDGQGTTPGGKELVVAINDATHALGGTSVAEDLKGYEAITKRVQDGGFGFDAQWDGFGYDVTNVIAPGPDDGRDMAVLDRLLKGGFANDGFARLLFTETHDTVGNDGARLPARIDAANPTSIAARKRTMLAQTLLFTTPGVPMLFMGQEDLATSPFANKEPAPLAAKNDAMFAFTKDLVALRRNLGGKTGGLLDTKVEVLHRSDANKVIAYRRHGTSGEDVIVVLNLRNKAWPRYDVGVAQAGTWQIRIDADATKYGDDFGGGSSGAITALAEEHDNRPFTLPLALPAYGAIVLSK